MIKDTDPQSASLAIKQLQLHWLLQISKAINYNLPSPQLYQIYETILRDILKVKKLALFIHDSGWRHTLTYGVEYTLLPEHVEARLNELNVATLTNLQMPDWVQGFESIIPVLHNQEPLAYAFIGDVDHQHIESLKEVLPFIHTITNIIVVAIENKRLNKEAIKQAQMQKELELAAQMQSMLFPSKLPANTRIDIAATYLPHQQVGGDYYDYIELNKDEILICLADVSGKGISAALLMSNFQANLNARARHFTTLKDMVVELNDCVNKTAKGEKFVTVFLALINTKTHFITYINAGHNHPLLHHNNELSTLSTGTTGLGMFEELPFINEGIIAFPAGDTLFCYTDGIVEQENERGDVFGMDNMMALLSRHSDSFTMKDLHFRIVDEFIKFRKLTESLDDVTLLSCKSL